MQRVCSQGRPPQNWGRESEGEDRFVFQSWRKYSINITDVKLPVPLFKCYPPTIMDHSVYVFPSTTAKEVETPSCNRGCLLPVGRLVFLSTPEALRPEHTLGGIISSGRTDPFVVTNIPLAWRHSCHGLLPQRCADEATQSSCGQRLQDASLRPLTSNRPASLHLGHISSEST